MYYPIVMWRLIALIWLSMSLAMASGPAFAVPSPDCPMAASSTSPINHEEMDCCAADCAPECAVACPSAMIQLPGSVVTPADLVGAQPTMRQIQVLTSAESTGADPPPRTTFS